MRASRAAAAVLVLLTGCAAGSSDDADSGNGVTTMPANEGAMDEAIECSRAQHQAGVLFWRPPDGPVACRTFTGEYPPGPSPLAEYTVVGESVEVHHAILSGPLPDPWSTRFDAQPEPVDPAELQHTKSGIKAVTVHGHHGVLKWRNDEYVQRTSLEWVEPLEGTRHLEVRVDGEPLHPADLVRAARRLQRNSSNGNA